MRRRDGVAVIDLAGDIERDAEAALDAAWSAPRASGPTRSSSNFEDAGYINSTGIALIVGLLARARATGIDVRAYGLTDALPRDLRDHPAGRLHGDQPDEDSAVRGAEGSTDA